MTESERPAPDQPPAAQATPEATPGDPDESCRPPRPATSSPCCRCATSSSFPHMIVPLFVGREKSVRALEAVMKDDKQILLVAQKNAAQDDPSVDDIYRVGTVSTILQLLKLPDGTVKVLVEGGRRAKIVGFKETDSYFEAFVEAMPDQAAEAKELEALGRTVVSAVRAVHQAQQEDRPRGAGLAEPDRGAVEARRHRGQPSEPEDRREAGAARDRQGRRAAGARVRPHGVRDRRPAGREAHPQPREAADGEDAARVLPERAAQGDPEGTRRRRGRQGRERRARSQDQEDQAVEGSARQGHGGAEEAQDHEPDERRIDGGAQLPRLDAVDPVEASAARSATTSSPRRKC